MSVGEVCISVIDMSILASMIIVIVLVLSCCSKEHRDGFGCCFGVLLHCG